MSPTTPTYNGRSIKELSRAELQALFKAHGLKGANGKTADLIEILKDHMNKELALQPTDSAAPAAEPAEIDEFDLEMKIKQKLELDNQQETKETEDFVETQVHSPAEPAEPSPESSEQEGIKNWMSENKFQSLISIFEQREMLSWSVLQMVTLDSLTRLDIPMGLCLKFINALKMKFPDFQNEIKTTLSMDELKSVILEIIQQNQAKPPMATNIQKPKTFSSLSNLTTKVPVATPSVAPTMKPKVSQEFKRDSIIPKPILPITKKSFANVKPRIDAGTRKILKSTSNSSVANLENKEPVA